MNVFSCDECDYHTIFLSHWDRHLLSKKHRPLPGSNPVERINLERINLERNNLERNNLERNNLERNNLKEFKCELCNYVCYFKGDFHKHEKTKKHMILTNKITKEKRVYHCLMCKKDYSSASSLCKHKKICSEKSSKKVILPTEPSNIFTPDLVLNLLQKNAELQNMMLEQSEKHHQDMLLIVKQQQQQQEHQQHQQNQQQQPHQPQQTHYNNVTNNHLNLNVFLNETCKNALNFSEFMNSIQVSLEDLENTGRLGYVEGISRIFLNALKNTDKEHRPLHCTDIKRETVYIKEADKWDKETESLSRAIQYISDKNLGQIQEWKKENPDSLDSGSEKSEVLNQLYMVSLGGDKDGKIIKNVLKEVALSTK